MVQNSSKYRRLIRLKLRWITNEESKIRKWYDWNYIEMLVEGEKSAKN
jgi:hypothetical protein